MYICDYCSVRKVVSACPFCTRYGNGVLGTIPMESKSEKGRELVDKELIVCRSKEYGNNFPIFSKLLNNFIKVKYDIDIEITPADSAMILSLLKISRLASNPENDDSLIDFMNYCWLGIDYQEYVKMLEQQN